jgi:translation initiation factor IF-2
MFPLERARRNSRGGLLLRPSAGGEGREGAPLTKKSPQQLPHDAFPCAPSTSTKRDGRQSAGGGAPPPPDLSRPRTVGGGAPGELRRQPGSEWTRWSRTRTCSGSSTTWDEGRPCLKRPGGTPVAGSSPDRPRAGEVGRGRPSPRNRRSRSCMMLPLCPSTSTKQDGRRRAGDLRRGAAPSQPPPPADGRGRSAWGAPSPPRCSSWWTRWNRTRTCSGSSATWDKGRRPYLERAPVGYPASSSPGAGTGSAGGVGGGAPGGGGGGGGGFSAAGTGGVGGGRVGSGVGGGAG